MFTKELSKIYTPNLFFGVLINIIMATTLAFVNLGEVPLSSSFIWLGIIYLLCTFRLFVHFRNRDDLNNHHLQFVGVLLTACTWSISPYILFDSFAYTDKVLCLVIFSILSAGAASFLAANLKFAITYMAILLIPFSSMLIVTGDKREHLLGWLGILFWIAVTASTKQISLFIHRYIKNKIELNNWIDTLEEKIQKRTLEISELKQKDSLTGLLNRYSFVKNVEIALKKNPISHSNIGCFIHVDIKGFKKIIDIYGHSFGDYVLREVGNRIHEMDNMHNTISCSWNNDEFSLFFTKPGRTEIRVFVNNLLDYLNQPITKNSIRITPVHYLGVSVIDSETAVEDAMNQAYLSIIYSKLHNQNITYFNSEILHRHEREEFILLSLNQAIENDDLQLYFQPIVDVKTNEIKGCESLARWKLNDQFVPPDEFIAVAEQHGIIITLGNLLLEKAFIALKEINTINPSLSLSVNVSVIQFEDDNLIKHLQKLQQQYQIIPPNLHLELTETVMYADLDKLANIIKKVKAMGYAISIDDFGTGYSSISVFGNLSIDFIKLDKSYIDPICDESISVNIVDSVCRMSHYSNCKVIAEGVEHKEQLDKLSEISVDYYQGYYFSKPLPLTDFKALL